VVLGRQDETMDQTWPRQAKLRRRQLLLQGMALGLMTRGVAWATTADGAMHWRLGEARVLAAGRPQETDKYPVFSNDW
jgi:hypothetical protein